MELFINVVAVAIFIACLIALVATLDLIILDAHFINKIRRALGEEEL